MNEFNLTTRVDSATGDLYFPMQDEMEKLATSLNQDPRNVYTVGIVVNLGIKLVYSDHVAGWVFKGRQRIHG
jgi:hypothetical protein